MNYFFLLHARFSRYIQSVKNTQNIYHTLFFALLTIALFTLSFNATNHYVVKWSSFFAGLSLIFFIIKSRPIVDFFKSGNQRSI